MFVYNKTVHCAQPWLNTGESKHEDEDTGFFPNLLNQMDAYWRAANYLSVDQIYLYDNPLLKTTISIQDAQVPISLIVVLESEIIAVMR